MVENSNDRLSELPDELLVHILSFLSIKDAVRTLLVRRFGNLWTLLPTLIFKSERTQFISNVMKCHKSLTIDRWEIKGYHDISKKRLTKLVGLALTKKPKVLRIKGSYYYGYGNLTLRNGNIFNSQFVIILKLSRIFLNLPRQVNMGSLTILKLCSVRMVDKDMKLFELGCPNLQEVIIKYPNGLKKFHFRAPNIQRLKLYFLWEEDAPFYSIDCPKLKFLHIEHVCLDNLEIVNVSSITHVKIIPFSYIKRHHFELLYKKFQNAKVFHFEDDDGFGIFLGTKVSMQLEKCENKKVAFQQNDLSPLALNSGYHKSCLLGICRLLRYSRFLEDLILYVDMDVLCDCNMLWQELSSPCVIPYIKTVTIHDFEKQCKTLLQLLEFVLKSAVALEKLEIICSKKEQLTSTKGLEFILKLLRFKRASKNAEVVIA